MDYVVCQISGRQYLIKPGQVTEVDKLADEKKLKVDTVLLSVSGDKVELGSPFLKKALEFEILGTIKKAKIRVAKFHAKANYRRVSGSRAQKTQIRMLSV